MDYINQLSDEFLSSCFDQWSQIGKICQVSKRWNVLGRQIKSYQLLSLFKNSFSIEDYPPEDGKEILLFKASMWVEVSPYLKNFLTHHFDYFNHLWKKERNFSFQEHVDQRITLDDIDLDDFQEMVKVTYEGKDVNHTNFSNLLELASRFQSQRLLELSDVFQAKDISQLANDISQLARDTSQQAKDFSQYEFSFHHLVSLMTEETVVGEKSQAAITNFLDVYLSKRAKVSDWTVASDLKKLEHCYLNKLDLRTWVDIEDKHLENVAKISTLKNLKINYIEQSYITDQGLQFIGKLYSLTSLSLGEIEITDKGLSTLSGLKSLTSLELEKCKKITGGGMGNLTPLSSLKLEICDNVTDDGLTSLNSLSSLSSLSLMRCERITDKGLLPLINLRSLSHLNLGLCGEITDRGLSYLPESITSLDLFSCKKISDRGVQLFSRLRSLNYLDISNCKITDLGVSNLPESITSLDIERCKKIIDRGLLSISRYHSLTFLHFSYCHKITDVGLSYLLNLPSLSSLRLGDVILQKLACYL